MHAIAEVGRIKRDGFLTYLRSTGQRGDPDQQVIESVSVTLRTPDDPIARMPDGALLLVEVEDAMPLLSLYALDTHSRDAVLASIVESVTQNLEPLRFIAERRRATPIEKMAALIQA
ncbi:hypothetical protein A8H39_01195 [Paraburkholderia fungorum]|uniref:hypothetical protein n=1 Tax=Paraburkholderia fungorum TaxID=134537 RepID=UPI00048296C8|nr:hypothetical protein [Paraburkholderia fungorum]PNE59792.1 hypothetical protein A8H39_01195 [Paraburkholderia fungorum]